MADHELREPAAAEAQHVICRYKWCFIWTYNCDVVGSTSGLVAIIMAVMGTGKPSSCILPTPRSTQPSVHKR